VVTTAAGSSSPYDPSSATPNAWYAGGIFTIDGNSCGQGAVLNDAASGSVSVNSTANSASPGAYVSIYGTGLFEISPTPIASPAPASPTNTSAGGGLAWDFGAPNFSLPPLIWSGLAPGLVGVDQINAQIPADTREGCAVPLQIAYSAMTPPVTIAIRNGGGQCVDPPSAGYGQIIWQKTVSTTAANVATETDSMTALFETSPGQQAPPIPMYSDGCPGGLCDMNTIPSYTTLFGPSCAVPGYRSLGAGTVTIAGPGLTPIQAPLVPYQQGQLGGLTAYQATLPAGTVQAGNFTVMASGGADVGAFQTALQIGADIQIQTPLAGINAFPSCASLTINWTGGDPKSWITVRFIEQAPSVYGGYQSVMFIDQTHTSNGTMTIPSPFPLVENNSQFLCMNQTGPVTIAIEVDPDPSEIATFSASGISLGGKATWKYLHTFQANF
jgi:hypothetical protein